MKIKQLIILIALFNCLNLFAEDEVIVPESKFALGVNAGTKGLGLDGVLNLNNHFNLRASYSQFEFSESFDEEGIEYDGDLDIDVFGVAVDFYPFAGDFRISAGYYDNASSIIAEALAEAGNTVNINGFDYDISGESLRSDLDWDSGAPYLGIGWGNVFSDGPGFSVAFDIGVLFTDEPTATLTASQGLYTQAALAGRNLDADIATEEADLNSDLSEFDIYPVLQLSFNYSF